jgi:hypothetical protein
VASKQEPKGLADKRADYETVFSSQAGQRVLGNLMADFHMGRSSHAAGDSHETAFREGERHVVLHIMSMVGKRGDPEWTNDKLDQAQIEYSVIQEFS